MRFTKLAKTARLTTFAQIGLVLDTALTIATTTPPSFTTIRLANTEPSPLEVAKNSLES